MATPGRTHIDALPGELRAGQAAGGRLLTARGRRTRAALVEAAKLVFAETPFADTRIADITARAGVANGTFYTYFDSKEEIFREVAADVLAAMLAAPRRDPDNIERDPIRDVEHASREPTSRSSSTTRSSPGRSSSSARRPRRVGERRTARSSARSSGPSGGSAACRRQGICDDIDPWTTAMALQTMTIRVAYDHLLPGGTGEGSDDDEVDVDAMARAVSRIWARTVGLERVTPRGEPADRA